MEIPHALANELAASIYQALVSARNNRQLTSPLPAVKVSLNPSGSVLVHLLPVGILGPYWRKQIPHAVLTDFKRLAGLNLSQGRTKSVPVNSLPPQQTLAELLHAAAGSGVAPLESESPRQRARKPVRSVKGSAEAVS